MLKKYCLLTLIALFILGFTSVACAGSQDFELVNATGFNLRDLFISPSGQNHWGQDVLAGHSLKDGTSVHISFPEYDANMEEWDILIHDDSGEGRIWHKLHLNAIHTVTLHGDATAKLH